MTGARRNSSLQTRVEGAASLAELPYRRLAGSARANVLPFAGKISVFLFGIVVLSGVYITLFYEYGFAASYAAVLDMDGHPIQRVVRAVHRYSSAALVVTTLVHAYRMFVAGRFTASRRFRWVTGLVALATVWLAGVTGYWLIWDVRAQAIGEAVNRAIGSTSPGAAIVAKFIGSTSGNGAGTMLVVWLLHLGLTAVIGWALWRHLRRSRLGWIPPRHWMVLMMVGLLIVSIGLPVGMLAPADPGGLVPDMGLDPFMLFLLPPLLGDHAGLVLAGMVGVLIVAVAVPWLLRPRAAAVVTIDAAQCTGCDLCVVDCPYLALQLVDSIAVVDPAVCVGCGICVGSCSFGAIDLPGVESPSSIDPSGRDVVIACARHLDHGLAARPGRPSRHQDGGENGGSRHGDARGDEAGDDEALVITVNCAGAFHSQAVGELVRKGATSVQLVGCAPGECVYGIGNVLAHERLSGERAPHLARKYTGVAAEDFVAVGDGAAARRHPGEHPEAAANTLPASTRSRAVAGSTVMVSVALIAVATLLPFGGRDDRASLRVIVNHVPGSRLIGQERVVDAVSSDATPVVDVTVDGDRVLRSELHSWSGRQLGVFDLEVPAGAADLTVRLVPGDDAEAGVVLFDGPTEFTVGRRFIVEALDAPPPPGVEEGRKVFEDPRLGACVVCHATEPGGNGVGPDLAGMSTRAATRVPGLSAEEYLTQSILDPNAYIVEGYRADQMLPIYRDRLTNAQVESLVDYLMSLEGEGE